MLIRPESDIVKIRVERGGVYLKTPNGMMEWWKNGILG